jgi:sulfhydrogenase subunit beta (sulfur reductase)
MGCTVWRLSESQLREWLGRLLNEGYTVVAPVREDGVLLFGRVGSADLVTLSPSGKTRWSPKEFLFPRSEPLYGYVADGDTIKLSNPPRRETRQVLFGVRPCDAAGIARLDRTFLGGVPDTIYGTRRENTTIISTACGAADPECFCTAVSGSPIGEEGSDAQIIPLDDGWLVRSLTDKGAALIEATSAGWTAATKRDQGKIKEIGKRVSAEIERRPIDREWGQLLEQGFDHPVWERASQRCLGCSLCAYVCPSCSCFDMNQEGDTWHGKQCRSWDACTFELFTRHASGHNPRPSRSARYRQRVLHKFAFATADSDAFRCVGCGRCIALCPAGLNIVEAAQAVVTAVQEEPRNAGG